MKERKWMIVLVAMFLFLSCEVLVLHMTEQVHIELEDDYVVLEYGENYEDDATANIWNKIDVTKWMYTNSEIDTCKLGKQKIFYSCFGARAIRTVEVVDTQSPSIRLLGEEHYELEDFTSYVEPGYWAIDTADGDITENVVVVIIESEDEHEYNYILNYAVTDKSGNKSEARRLVTVSKPEEIKEETTGIVYLTFDDGPSELTPDYLDVLKRYGVNATFFVIGFSEEDKWKIPIMQRALEEGNQIALHGKSHEYSMIYQSKESAVNNFAEENRLLKEFLNLDVKVIRFPGGASNTVSRNYCTGVMSMATEELVKSGYSYFDWNVDSNDAGGDVQNSQKIYQNVIDGIQPGRENVVLMHDCGGHSATLEALSQIIEKLQEEGYEFKTITSDTTPVRHAINN